MSGECEQCSEHCLDCLCNVYNDPVFELSLAALNLAMMNFSFLGFEIGKIEINLPKDKFMCADCDVKKPEWPPKIF